MNRVNESYLTNLIKDLHHEENECFTPNPFSKTQMVDDKLNKLQEQKARQISNLKYQAQKLKQLIEKIDYQIKNPKIKAVGI